MDPGLIFLFIFLLGMVTGLRAFIAPAATAWAAHLGWIHLDGTPLAFMGGTPAVSVLSFMAVMELIWDKLPMTPRRTAPPGVIARLVSGALVGACLGFTTHQSVYFCASLGAMGGLFGAFFGYYVRTRMVRVLKVPDFIIAVLEDAVAIGGSVFLLSHFS